MGKRYQILLRFHDPHSPCTFQDGRSHQKKGTQRREKVIQDAAPTKNLLYLRLASQLSLGGEGRASHSRKERSGTSDKLVEHDTSCKIPVGSHHVVSSTFRLLNCLERRRLLSRSQGAPKMAGATIGVPSSLWEQRPVMCRSKSCYVA